MDESEAFNDKLFNLISQDLKEPLMDMEASFDLIKPSSEDLTPEDKESLIDAMKNTNRQSLDLIENLTAWARRNILSLEAPKVPLLLKDTILSLVSKLGYLWRAKDIDLQIQIPQTLVLPVEPFLLTTILRNLLTNAVKFSHRGGVVRICAGWTPESRWIQIEDAGIGLPPGGDEVFQLRIAPSRPGTEGEKGHGFGLWLSRNLVTQLGGELTLKPSPGGGTTARLQFREEPMEDIGTVEA